MNHYFTLVETYDTLGHVLTSIDPSHNTMINRYDALETLQAGLKYARRDVRLNLAINRLVERRPPVFSFLSRRHPLNRQIGRLRHRTLGMFGNS